MTKHPSNQDEDYTIQAADSSPPILMSGHEPTVITFTLDGKDVVSIDLETAELTIHDEAHQEEVPRIFWESVELYGLSLVKRLEEAKKCIKAADKLASMVGDVPDWYINLVADYREKRKETHLDGGGFS